MAGKDLTLAQRIRVVAALHPQVIIHVDRDTALVIVRALEGSARVEDALADLKADFDARVHRIERRWSRTSFLALFLASVALALVIGLAVTP